MKIEGGGWRKKVERGGGWRKKIAREKGLDEEGRERVEVEEIGERVEEEGRERRVGGGR